MKIYMMWVVGFRGWAVYQFCYFCGIFLKAEYISKIPPSWYDYHYVLLLSTKQAVLTRANKCKNLVNQYKELVPEKKMVPSFG